MKLQSNKLHAQSSISINTMQEKSRFINGIAKNLRARSYLLLSMLNEKDAFVLDKLNQALYHQAFLFRKNRDALRALPLTSQQLNVFESLLVLTQANSLNQIKVADLLINDDKSQAAALLFDHAIPNQVTMTAVITRFIELVEKENGHVLKRLQGNIDKNQNISAILILILSFFAITFISFLINLLKGGDTLLANKTTIHNNLINSTLDAIVLTNNDGMITIFNKGASALFGYKASDILNKHINTILTINFNDLVTLEAKNVKLNKENKNPYFEDQGIHKDSHLIPIQLAITDTGIHGEQRFNLIIRDLSLSKETERRLMQQTCELEKARARYKELSETDPLTNIANRRAYENRLLDEINAAKRSTKPLALVIFDVDYFKNYNDYYGHKLGDTALKRIAQVISKSLPRSTDFSGRFGGEEFVVLLPATDTFGAHQVAEKIRLGIKSLGIKHEKSDTDSVITISAGISALSGDCLNDTNLFKQADEALYKAKAAGRNRIDTFNAINQS